MHYKRLNVTTDIPTLTAEIVMQAQKATLRPFKV
jgi:hypothetical protein